MSLNKVKDDMYSWLTHTYNCIKDECPHCYMKRWGKQPDLHFDEKELKTDLGSGNFIFCGSSCDMWAETIPVEWIHRTLEHCRKFNNRYLFQSKNPGRIYELRPFLPADIIVGTTIESNRKYPGISEAPNILDRAWSMFQLDCAGYETCITIEPIINFDLEIFIRIVKVCNPKFVNIGANTNSKVKLPEPSPEKIKDLIQGLLEFTAVKLKPNLGRLIP